MSRTSCRSRDGVEIADFDFRRARPFSISAICLRERGRGERRILPRSRVVERSREEHMLAVFVDAAPAEHLLRKLADARKAGRPGRVVLAQRRDPTGGTRGTSPVTSTRALTPALRSASSR